MKYKARVLRKIACTNQVFHDQPSLDSPRRAASQLPETNQGTIRILYEVTLTKSLALEIFTIFPIPRNVLTFSHRTLMDQAPGKGEVYSKNRLAKPPHRHHLITLFLRFQAACPCLTSTRSSGGCPSLLLAVPAARQQWHPIACRENVRERLRQATEATGLKR
jgi:hypothetical protein